MGRTVLEKITQRFAVGWPEGRPVRSGDVVRIRPFHVMTHDNTGAVIPKFRSIGASAVHDPSQPVFAIDHDIQNESPENLAKPCGRGLFLMRQLLDEVSYNDQGNQVTLVLRLESGGLLEGGVQA